jgi:hypothetical protein
MKMFRLPGGSVLQRSLCAVAVYACFYVVLMGVLHVASAAVATGHADVTPQQAPAVADAP